MTLNLNIDEIELFRKAFDLTVEQFCQFIGCSKSLYYKCLKNERVMYGEVYIVKLYSMYQRLSFDRQANCKQKLTPNELDHFIDILNIYKEIYGDFY